jgi:hypothetical protein
MNENEQVKSKYVDPGWVDTPTSQSIWAALQHAQTKPTIVLIHGGAGIGKTWTINDYREEKKSKYGRYNVYLVTAEPCTGTVTGILASIDVAMGGLGDAHGYRSDHLARSIRKGFYPGDLLAIDEAQNLRNEALDQVRAFHDQCGIGIAFLSNNEVFTRIHGRSKQAEVLTRISSRMGMDLSIPFPTKDDVMVFMKAWGIDGQKEHHYGCTIAQDQGKGLRGLAHVIEMAAIFTETKGLVLNASTLRMAAASLGYI